jgi:hypothetical protein
MTALRDAGAGMHLMRWHHSSSSQKLTVCGMALTRAANIALRLVAVDLASSARGLLAVNLRKSRKASEGKQDCQQGKQRCDGVTRSVSLPDLALRALAHRVWKRKEEATCQPPSPTVDIAPFSTPSWLLRCVVTDGTAPGRTGRRIAICTAGGTERLPTPSPSPAPSSPGAGQTHRTEGTRSSSRDALGGVGSVNGHGDYTTGRRRSASAQRHTRAGAVVPRLHARWDDVQSDGGARPPKARAGLSTRREADERTRGSDRHTRPAGIAGGAPLPPAHMRLAADLQL